MEQINNDNQEYKLLQEHFKHQKRQIERDKFVTNEDITKYDSEFVNFYRNGTLKIEDRDYSVGDLYIVMGKVNGEEKRFLVHYGNRTTQDIITKEIAENFKRTSLILFKDAACFYELYLKYKEDIANNILEINDTNKEFVIESIKNNNSAIHIEVPETYYYVEENKNT